MKISILLLLVSIYIVIILFFYFFQRSFLYFPDENNYLTSEIINKENKVLNIRTKDNLNLKSYLYFEKKNRNTILFLHGNAGTLNNRIYKLNIFKNLGFNYLAVTWRGFSGNKGSPTEKGLTLDALSGLDYLNSLGIKDNEVVIYGESLGTGVGVNVSTIRSVKGLILESPYTSVGDVGKIKFPFLPIDLILKDKFDTRSKISSVKCPILVMHGYADKIVPFHMGKEIFDSINSKKYSHFVDDDHMMDLDHHATLAIQSFFNSIN